MTRPDPLRVGDIIEGNGRRLPGRKRLRVFAITDGYAFCDIPGRSDDLTIRLALEHIHTDGLRRKFGWDRIGRMEGEKAWLSPG